MEAIFIRLVANIQFWKPIRALALGNKRGFDGQRHFWSKPDLVRQTSIGIDNIRWLTLCSVTLKRMPLVSVCYLAFILAWIRFIGRNHLQLKRPSKNEELFRSLRRRSTWPILLLIKQCRTDDDTYTMLGISPSFHESEGHRLLVLMTPGCCHGRLQAGRSEQNANDWQ